MLRRGSVVKIARDRVRGPTQEQSFVTGSTHRTTLVEHSKSLDNFDATNRLLASMGLFAMIASDLFSPFSLHLLPHIDAAVHLNVTEHLDASFRNIMADILISDVAILASLFGWLAASSAVLALGNWRQLNTLLAAWSVYVFGVGAVPKEAPVVDILKHLFSRARPSDIHHTFSFPSGHTTAAVFMMGALLYVMIPLAVSAAHRAPTLKVQEVDVWAMPSWYWDLCPRLWMLGGGMTAVGRVMADAHWVSDTMAGACLGVAFVNLLSLAASKCMKADAS